MITAKFYNILKSGNTTPHSLFFVLPDGFGFSGVFVA
jgi:hypothetical protein